MTLSALLRPFLIGWVLLMLDSSAMAQTRQDAFVKWTTEHAIPLSTVEANDNLTDLAPLKTIIGSARVVALGELTHGSHEPLAFRNRLIRFLVAQMGFTAVLLEDGFTESWSINEFVTSGKGDLTTAVREGFTWGFGQFGENRELVDWMRRYNSDPARQRGIRFYGVDLPGGSSTGDYTTSRRSVDFAIALLARADAAAAGKIRVALEPVLSKFNDQLSGSLSPADYDRLDAALSDLSAAITLSRGKLAAMTSSDEYDWAQHSIDTARQLSRVFRLQPPASAGQGVPPGAGPSMTARESAMAENVRWALQHEGDSGKVIVFAHDLHVMNSKLAGGFWSGIQEKPPSMGTFLRSAFGDNVVIIGAAGGSTAGAGLPKPEPLPDSLDSLLAKVGLPQFIIDLRPARANSAVFSWLSETQSLRANLMTHVSITPTTAFDALFFVDKLTRSHRPPP